ITARDDLAAGACHQSGRDADAEVGPQETHRAVREPDVGPAGVEAVHLVVVAAIEGARPRMGGAIAGRALKNNPGPEPRPGSAGDLLVRPGLARLPEPWPAGILGEQQGVRGPVGDAG